MFYKWGWGSLTDDGTVEVWGMCSEAASSLYHFPPHSKEKLKEALPRSDFHFCKVFQTFYLFFLISETQSEWL